MISIPLLAVNRIFRRLSLCELKIRVVDNGGRQAVSNTVTQELFFTIHSEPLTAGCSKLAEQKYDLPA